MLILLIFASMLPALARSHFVAADDSGHPLFEHLSTIGEGVYDLAVAGGLVYALEGDTLTILDVSDSSRPARLGQMTLLADAFAIQVAGGLAFVSGSQRIVDPLYNMNRPYIAVFDIRNPAQPVLRETYQDAVAVQVVGNRAYIAVGKHLYVNNKASLEIIDVSDPARLKPLGRYDVPDDSSVGDVQVVDSRVYMVKGANVLVIDAHDPTRPALLGWCETPEQIQALQVAGNFIYAASEQGLWVVDANEPTRPALRGSVRLPGVMREVQVFGAMVYVTLASPPSSSYTLGTFLLVDVHDPDHPRLRGRYDTPGWIAGVEIVGEVAYIASANRIPFTEKWEGMVQLVRVSDPDQLVALFAVYPRVANDMQVVGDRLYVAAGRDGLSIVSLRAPYTIMQGDVLSPLISSVWVAGSRTYALVTQEDVSNLVILDTRNPRRPRLLAMVATFGEVTDVQEVADRIYLAGATSLVIYDVHDPANPILESISYIAGGAQIMRVVDNLIYITTESGQLKIIDVREPAYPMLRAAYQAPGRIRALQVRDGFAYLTSGSAFHVIDIHDPAAPVLRGDYTFPYLDLPGIMQIVGERAYLVSESLQLLTIIDLHDPAAPALLGSFNFSQFRQYFVDMSVSGDRVYLACNYLLNQHTYVGVFLTVDVRDPAAPALLNRKEYNFIRSMQIAGDLAYLTIGEFLDDGRIEVLDLADVAAPTRGFYATGFLEQVQVVGELAYLKGYLSGLQILRLHTDLLPAGATIPPEGGSLTTPDGSLHLSFPPGAVASPASVSYTGSLTPTHPLNLRRGMLRSFTLAAQEGGGAPITQLNQGAMLVISYTDTLLASQLITDAQSLNVVAWDGQAWVDLLPCEGCVIDSANHQVIAPIERLTEFALVGERHTTFMPLVAH